jgi:8-oxo-dGTP pyrophosphatase MutT (NUDIX family)
MQSEPPSAAARRRATSDPRVFLIPDEQLPPGFAERVDRPIAGPAAARPAATVVLLRETHAAGVEALLLRRPARSRFAADAWVFPGGALDEADIDPALAAHLDGPDAGTWATRLGLPRPEQALGFVVAALREAWEETGMLLGSGASPAAREAARGALLASDEPLTRLLHRSGIRLDTGRLLYLAHWITPEPEPRRYDTRFFAARVPVDAECVLHGDELAEARWVTPTEAVDGFHAGDLTLLPPTIDTLRRLADHRSLDAVWAELSDRPVPAVLPVMRRVPGGVEIDIGER